MTHDQILQRETAVPPPGECARPCVTAERMVLHARRRTGALALLAGCCGLLIPTANAAEWNGIKVADPTPKVTVTPVQPGSRASALPTQEGATVQAVWDAFVGGLRSGQMRAAYAQLAPASRDEMNYRDFCAAWHPLSLRYEEVLSPPGFSEFRVSGDIATLRLGLRQPPRGNAAADNAVSVYGAKGSFLQAVLIREDGRWWVLDGKNIDNAIAEASARNVLTRLVRDNGPVRDALQKGGTLTISDLRRLMPRFFEETATGEFLRNYRLEIDALRDGVVRAIPAREGIRGYRLGLEGALAALPKQPASRSPLAATAILPEQIAPVPPVAKPATQPVPAQGAQRAAAPVPAKAAPNSTTTQQSLPPLPPAFGDPDQLPAQPPAAPAPARTKNDVAAATTTPRPVSRPSGGRTTPGSAPAPISRPEPTPVRQPATGDDFALPEFEDEQPKRMGASASPAASRTAASASTIAPAPATERNLLMTAPAGPTGAVPTATGIRNLGEYEVPAIQDSVVMPAEVSLPAVDEPIDAPVPSMKPAEVKASASATKAAKSAPPSVPAAADDGQELKGLLDSLIENGKSR